MYPSQGHIHSSFKKIHQLLQKTSYRQDYDPEKKDQGHQNVTCLKPATVIYPRNADEHPAIGSRNISCLRKPNHFKLAIYLDTKVKVKRSLSILTRRVNYHRYLRQRY